MIRIKIMSMASPSHIVGNIIRLLWIAGIGIIIAVLCFLIGLVLDLAAISETVSKILFVVAFITGAIGVGAFTFEELLWRARNKYYK